MEGVGRWLEGGREMDDTAWSRAVRSWIRELRREG